MMKEIEQKIQDLLNKYEEGTLRIGDCLECKLYDHPIVIDYTKAWIKFDEKQQQLFTDTVEKDPNFTDLVEYLHRKYHHKAVHIDSVEKGIKKSTNDLSDRDKFVAMLYIGMKSGIKYDSTHELWSEELENKLKQETKLFECLEELSKKREGKIIKYADFKKIAKKFGIPHDKEEDRDKFPFYLKFKVIDGGIVHEDPSVEIDVKITDKEYLELGLEDYLTFKNEERLPYKISTWGRGTSQFLNIVNTFNLNKLVSTWDEETAVNDPLLKDWNLDWQNIAKNYLAEKGDISIAKEYRKRNQKLKDLLDIDKKLSALITYLDASEEELREHYGVNNLFSEYDSIKDRVESSIERYKIKVPENDELWHYEFKKRT